MKAEVPVYYLSGDLIDKNNATEFLADVESNITEGRNKFVLDLNELKYVNSSGLTVLIHILAKARKNDGEVVICRLSTKVRELLVVTKLHTVFTVTDSVEESLKKFEE